MKRDLEASKYIMVHVCQVQLCEVENINFSAMASIVELLYPCNDGGTAVSLDKVRNECKKGKQSKNDIKVKHTSSFIV
jgi:hypothetical protein